MKAGLIMNAELEKKIEDCKNKEKLFDLWKKEHKRDNDYKINSYDKICKYGFTEDGEIFKDFYDNSKVKVLYVLKEGNVCYEKDEVLCNCHNLKLAHSEIKWIKGYIIGSKKHRLLRTIAFYQMILQGEINSEKMINDDWLNIDNKTEKETLKKIAVIELNKRGGQAKAIETIISEYVNKYKAFIKKEIELIKPKYIVCCGDFVFKEIKNIYNIKDDNICFFKSNDNQKIFLNAYHPSYRRYNYEKTLKKLLVSLIEYKKICK